jgi:hypothetical protein
MNLRNYVVIAALLLAAPLSAQQDSTVAIVTINGDTVMVDIDVLIEHNTDARSDSALVAAFDRNMERLADLIAERECNTCGGATNTAKFALGVVGPLLLWLAISAHRQAGKDDSHTVNNEVEVNVPPREKREREDSEH